MANEKEILTTFEAARYCHVHPGTIKNWIRSDFLKAFKTPGGHRRIYKRDLDKFLDDRDIPVNRDEAPGSRRKRVLLIEHDYHVREEISNLLQRWNGVFEVAAVGNAFEGGEMLVVFRPEIVIIDLAIGGLDPATLYRHIRSSSHLDAAKVIGLTDEVTAMQDSQPEAVLCARDDIKRLRQEIEKAIEVKKTA